MKQVVCFILSLLSIECLNANFSKEILSPDKQIRVLLDGSDKLSFKVFRKNELLIRNSELNLVVLGELAFEPGNVKKISQRTVN